MKSTYVWHLVDLFRWLLVVRVHAGARTPILRHVLLRTLIPIQVEALRSMTGDLVVEAAAVLCRTNTVGRGTRLTAHVSRALLYNSGSRRVEHLLRDVLEGTVHRETTSAYVARGVLLAAHDLGIFGSRTHLVVGVLERGQVGRSSHGRNASDAVLLGLARCNARSNGLHLFLIEVVKILIV